LLAQESDFIEAKLAEENFEWLRAAELYLRKLTPRLEGAPEDSREFPTTEYQRIVNCYVRASFQSNDPLEFRKRVESAIKICEIASLETLQDASDRASSFFSGQALLLKSWIAEDPASRRANLDGCLKTINEAIEPLDQFETRKFGLLNYSLLLLRCLEELWVSEENAEKLDDLIGQGILAGSRTIERSSTSIFEKDDLKLLAEIYYLTAWFCGLGVFHFESFEKRMELLNLREAYWSNFDSLADELGDSFLIAKSLIYRQEDLDLRIVRTSMRDTFQDLANNG